MEKARELTVAEEPAKERKLRYISLDDAKRIAEGVFDRHSELFKKLAE